MKENIYILSVMVVAHNQVQWIERCIESILRQRIRVPWEIVISDDASTDGTWQWITHLVHLTPNQLQEKIEQIRGTINEDEYLPNIVCCQINSSDYNPTVTSDRCAANKANAYSHACGKYCVNIDADDYLVGNDIYQYQIEQLEAHPECTMAMQNIWCVKDKQPLESGGTWHWKEAWKEGEIMTMEDYCHRRLFISNPAFMMRRDDQLKPMDKYGLYFDDPIISMHHLTRGKIICTLRAQYVYVQYHHSIWNQVLATDDVYIRMLTPLLVYLKFFPSLTNAFLSLEAWPWIDNLKKIRSKPYLNITISLVQYIQRLGNSFLLGVISSPNKFSSYVALKLILAISKFGASHKGLNKLFLWLIQ